MKYSINALLGCALFTVTSASRLAIGNRYFEKCTEGSELIDPPQCPEVDPEQPVYFPFPTDCEQYYQCSNGIARCIKCAPGTVWDQVNLVCNHPDAVNCTVTTTTAMPTTTNGPPENVICEQEAIGLFAHPTNCSLFILCDPGRLPCIIECPEGTCYNNNTNTCEYPNKGEEIKHGSQTSQDQYAYQTKFRNYRNLRRDNFADAIQFVAKTLTNRRLEKTDEDSCEMLNFYVRNA